MRPNVPRLIDCVFAFVSSRFDMKGILPHKLVKRYEEIVAEIFFRKIASQRPVLVGTSQKRREKYKGLAIFVIKQNFLSTALMCRQTCTCAVSIASSSGGGPASGGLQGFERKPTNAHEQARMKRKKRYLGVAEECACVCVCVCVSPPRSLTLTSA